MGKEGPSPPVAPANVKGEAEQSGPSHPIGRKSRAKNGTDRSSQSNYTTGAPSIHFLPPLLFLQIRFSVFLKSSSSSETRREKEVTGFRTCPIRQGRKRIALDSVFFLLVLLFCHGSAMRVMSCERGSLESGDRVCVCCVGRQRWVGARVISISPPKTAKRKG